MSIPWLYSKSIWLLSRIALLAGRLTNCTRAGLEYPSRFHCHITDSKQVRQVKKIKEQFQFDAFSRKFYAYLMLIMIPVWEAILILFIDLFVDYFILVDKPKKQENMGKERAEEMIRLNGFQRERCQVCFNWFMIWSRCRILKTWQ
jgi:hypothetical protein